MAQLARSMSAGAFAVIGAMMIDGAPGARA
jgi:hypothetical protein